MNEQRRVRRLSPDSAALIAIAALTAMGFTQGQSIPIINAGFDSLLLNCTPGAPCFEAGVIPGWTLTGVGNSTFKPSTGTGGIFPGGIPGGLNVAAVNCSGCAGGAISQDLGFAPLPNTTYTLTAYVGQRADAPFATYAVELLVGTKSVASDTTLKPAPGTFLLDTVPYNSGSSPPAGDLIIQLSAGAQGQAEFAQIALMATSVAPTMQILPHLAFGGGWYTDLYFTNISSAPVSFTVNFIGDDGNPVTIPAPIGGSSVVVNLAARSTALLQAPNVGSLAEGYVSVALPSGVSVYGVFGLSVPGQPVQEAVVPLSGTTAITSTLLFDNANYTTGVALVNLSSVSATISAIAYDNLGNMIATSAIPLAANAHKADVLTNFPGLAALAGLVGSVDFTSSAGTLALLGIRSNGSAFTSIPVSNR